MTRFERLHYCGSFHQHWCSATLREAMRGTPAWLGFNIELKYPTDAEIAAMTTRWYTRNFFVDAILKVRLIALRTVCAAPKTSHLPACRG